MRIFDVYANILKYMYSTRFSGAEASPDAQPTPIVDTSLTRTIDTFRPDKFKRRRKLEESQESKDK